MVDWLFLIDNCALWNLAEKTYTSFLHHIEEILQVGLKPWLPLLIFLGVKGMDKDLKDAVMLPLKKKGRVPVQKYIFVHILYSKKKKRMFYIRYSLDFSFFVWVFF